MADDINDANDALDLSGLGSFDFTPDWAKGRSDDKSRYARFEGRDDDRADDRRPSGDRRQSGARKPFDRERKPFDKERKPFDRERKPFGDRGQRRDDRPRREFVKPLDVDVRILPSQKELGPIIRQLQTKHTAYALKQLAYLFLDNPSACMLRIASKKDAAEPILFYQCKVCGFSALTADEVSAHALTEHLSDYYDVETVDCEPPKGTFTCVAKCGVTGELLGPPNLHGYDSRIREMLRTRCPGMSEAAYRARIEMVRDSDTIEQWRAGATKKTVYRRKGEESAVDREAAEAEFRRTILPGLIQSAKTVDMTAEMALKSPCRPLVFACRDALAKERRFPASLFYALRGAFHHRKLKFFRANDPRGPEFVVAQDFSPLDVEHVIPELAELVKFVEEHPCITQVETVQTLSQGDAAKAEETKKTLAWLIEKGHLVGYFNGVLAIPAQHPKYHPPSPRKAPAKTDAPKAETPAETPAEPVAETPVETPAEPAAEAPAETPAEPAAEAPAETPTEPVAEAPAETPAEAPAEPAPTAES